MSDPPSESYLRLTRDPIPCLVFLVPLILLYEAGVSAWGWGLGRAGADLWLRHRFGIEGTFADLILPGAVVGALLALQVVRGGSGRISIAVTATMAVESLAWAIVLVGVSKLVDLGFDRIDSVGPLVVAPASRPAAALLGFLGAGIYEEAVFRLAMIPLIFGLGRLLQLPEIGANVLAVTASSLLFSLAHHIGAPSEVFSWYAFVFRWAAGIFFAWVFVVRGFGVAVGTHALYDVLVGYLEWTL